MALLPCPSCARHVRSTERACPFCQRSIAERAAPDVDFSAYRSRAALAAFVAVATSTAACGATMQQQEVQVVQQQHVVVQQPEPVVVQQVIVQQPDPVVVQQPVDNTVIVVRPPRPQPVVQPQPVVVQPDPCCTTVPAYGIAPYNPTPDPGGPVSRYGAPPPPEEG